MKYDAFLRILVASASKGLRMSITLTVKGAVIAGTLVDYNTFFQQLAEHIRTHAQGSPEAIQGMAEAFETLAQEEPTKEMDPLNEEAPPAFIHLFNAKILVNGQTYPVHFWRGRLDAVDGFSFGAPSS